MPDKKMNVLDRILCVFKSKKDVPDDILSQADRVIETYIYNKNKLIHRKCSKSRRADTMAALTAITAFAAVAVLIFKAMI